MNFDLSGGGGGGVKGRHKPNAITQRDAIFLFSKVNTTIYGKKFFKICKGKLHVFTGLLAW